MNLAQRSAIVFASALAFVGLWLLFAPFYGPPRHSTTGRTAELVRTGNRPRCSPPFVAAGSDGSGDALKKIACQSVGVGRWETGWMLIVTAAFTGGLGVWLLRT